MSRVLKLGGRLLEDTAGLADLGAWIATLPAVERPVLLHGGGDSIAQLQTALGLERRTVDGLRVTPPAAMPAVEMALSGDANKRLVRALLRAGVEAVGMSGIDRGLLRCTPLPHPTEDLGRVGEIIHVRAELLRALLADGVVPVLSPVSLGIDGEAYNVNADDAAAAVAAALETELVLLTDVPGVLVEGNVMPHLRPEEAERLIDIRVIRGGMVPKVRAAQRAAERGAPTRITDLVGLAEPDAGTLIGRRRPGARPTVASAARGSRPTASVAATAPAPSPAPDSALPTDSAMPTNDAPNAPSPSAPDAPGTPLATTSPPTGAPSAAVDAAALVALDAASVLQVYPRPDIVFTRGEGAWLFDSAGERYLDFHAGIAVAALGHGDPALSAVVAGQAARLTHVSNLHYTPPYIRLAGLLTQSCFADKVFFTNAGGEAVEGAIKFARKRARVTWEAEHGTGEGAPPFAKTRIVACERSFHGRSAGALSLTHKAQYRAPFLPLLPDVDFVPFNDLAAAEAAITDETCAVFVEPTQGEGGYHPATTEFLQGLRHACDAHGALLVLDEIQCGVGRTGYLWAHQGYDLAPDILCAAKPLANGLPIGAILMTQHVADAMGPGDHGSTFAGGPLVCAAAEHVFARIAAPDFLAEVRRKGALLVERLHAMESDHMVDVRGSGLMIGAEFDAPIGPLVVAMRERRVLTLGAGTHTLRLCPPLIVDDAQIVHFVDTLSDCLEAGVLEA